jgi:hypothetical protein
MYIGMYVCMCMYVYGDKKSGNDPSIRVLYKYKRKYIYDTYRDSQVVHNVIYYLFIKEYISEFVVVFI